MSLSSGESFLRLSVRVSGPDALLGHIAAPMSLLQDNRLPPAPLSCTLVRHQTPRILAAPARTAENALVVEEQTIAPSSSTSRPRPSSSPQRRVLCGIRHVAYVFTI